MTNHIRPKDGTNVRKIVAEWLLDNEYDGLVNTKMECGCTIEKLGSCVRIDGDCRCAYRVNHLDDPGTYTLALHQDIPVTKTQDMITHPDHYCSGPIESIDAIHSALGDEGFLDFCLGTMSRYNTRCGKKPGNTVELDVRKIRQYCDFILEKLPASILKSTRESR